MEGQDIPVGESPHTNPAEQTEKKPWTPPEITWHQSLRVVTLGIQCSSQPPVICPSPEDLFV